MRRVKLDSGASRVMGSRPPWAAGTCAHCTVVDERSFSARGRSRASMDHGAVEEMFSLIGR